MHECCVSALREPGFMLRAESDAQDMAATNVVLWTKKRTGREQRPIPFLLAGGRKAVGCQYYLTITFRISFLIPLSEDGPSGILRASTSASVNWGRMGYSRVLTVFCKETNSQTRLKIDHCGNQSAQRCNRR